MADKQDRYTPRPLPDREKDVPPERASAQGDRSVPPDVGGSPAARAGPANQNADARGGAMQDPAPSEARQFWDKQTLIEAFVLVSGAFVAFLFSSALNLFDRFTEWVERYDR